MLPYKETQTLAAFEKLRFNEMHQIILEDDGFPHLYQSIQDIRFDIENIDFNNYQGIKLGRTNNVKDTKHSKSKVSNVIEHTHTKSISIDNMLHSETSIHDSHHEGEEGSNCSHTHVHTHDKALNRVSDNVVNKLHKNFNRNMRKMEPVIVKKVSERSERILIDVSQEHI